MVVINEVTNEVMMNEVREVVINEVRGGGDK